MKHNPCFKVILVTVPTTHLIKFKRGSDGFQKHKPCKATLFALNPLTQAWPVLRNETQSLPFSLPTPFRERGTGCHHYSHIPSGISKKGLGSKSGSGGRHGYLSYSFICDGKNILLSCIFPWGVSLWEALMRRMRAEVPKRPLGYSASSIPHSGRSVLFHRGFTLIMLSGYFECFLHSHSPPPQ